MNREFTNQPRQRALESWVENHFPPTGRREVLIDSALEKLDARTVAKAIKRAGRGGIVDLGSGEFEGFEVNRSVELLSREGGLTLVCGTIRVTAGPVALRGITIRPPSSEHPAMVISADTFLDNCNIDGAVELRDGATLYLRNCRLVAAGIALSLSASCKVEAAGCRFSGSPTAVLVEKGSEAAIFGSRVEECQGELLADGSGSPCAGIYCQGSLWLEGVEIFHNDVGIYLKESGAFHALACHFSQNRVAALVIEKPAPSEIHVAHGMVESHEKSQCAQVVIPGGAARFGHCQFRVPDVPSISSVSTKLLIHSCEFFSESAPCLDVAGGRIEMRESRCVSQAQAAVRVSQAEGFIAHCTLEGFPPLETVGNCSLQVTTTAQCAPGTLMPSDTASSVNDSLETYMRRLDEIVGQEAAKREFRRLLRMAHAARERRRKGLHPGEECFSGIFTGPPNCGQLHAANVFASILYDMGELRSPIVLELPLDEALAAEPEALDCGMIYIRMRDGSTLNLRETATAETLLLVARKMEGKIHIALEGDRDFLSALLRTRPELAREYPADVPFTPYGPPELAELFARHCQREKIPLGPEAARKLTVLLHSLHDRVQRRYADIAGIEGLFEEVRRNYLERCAREGRFDLPLEPTDISVPLDPASAASLDRLPEIVVLCPACGAENPWLPGLPDNRACIHCQHAFTGRWGILRNSAYYRKRRSGGEAFRSGAVARRRQAASAVSS